MSNPSASPGIHHVTCVAGDPQQNMDFWVEVLGLRLVKRSINQDDPGTYHFFFADAAGTPGTSMTFFPWSDLPDGKVGSGQVATTAFRVPAGSLDRWEARFDSYETAYQPRTERFGQAVLPFEDPDGLPLELVEANIDTADPTVPWTAFVSEEMAIRGFHSVTLWLADPDPTGELLGAMGFEERGTERSGSDPRTRYSAPGPVGAHVDLLPRIEASRQGHGTVHHVAFQTPTDSDQETMRHRVRQRGLQPTPQIDRHWFRSVYFREHGGVLFELATNGPGYDSDEPAESLGERLVLPGPFGERRAEVESNLPEVSIPTAEADGRVADGD
jgi:glyoxalase family protein